MIKYTGNGASGGLAVGKVKIINRRMPGFRRVVLAAHREQALYDAALVLAKSEIRKLCDLSEDEQKKDILNFQLMMLDDRGMNELITRGIEKGLGAAASAEAAMEEYCQRLRDTGDRYLMGRTGDIRDALSRVVDILDGKNRERFNLTEPCIVVADEILPSDLASIDRRFALGFVTVEGSYNSHSNIMARTMGIPSVCGMDEEILNPLNDGKLMCLDGYAGEAQLNPKDSTVALFTRRIEREKQTRRSLAALGRREIFAPDGQKVDIMVNCNDPADIRAAVENGADGVGLVRSEVLLMKRQPPDEEEQFHFYSGCITAAGGKPVTIRTFDIGADKQVPWLSDFTEPDPALGVRGVRMASRLPRLFRRQIRAMYKARDMCGDLNAMIPMVRTVSDVDAFFATALKIRDEMLENGEINKDRVTWGIMIETPAAALISRELAEKCRFFSIGTNDLIQYTCAADRVNEDVAPWYDRMHPAVLELIRITAENAGKAGIKVSVCGESAADPACRREYIKMGIRCLSMAHGALIPVKERLSSAAKEE